MSLDDIWGEPLVETPILRSNLASSRPSLFLSDSDDDEAPPSRTAPDSTRTAQAPQKEHLDALFGDEEDMFADVGAIDVEKLKRQAEAKVTAKRGVLPSVGPSSSPRSKDTKRREVPKLNEERLLGHDGFAKLLKEHVNFKPSGKGHEAADLEKLFRLYHGWTHKLFPKYKFRDTVERVEKLCRSRRMIVNLRVWKDEIHGVPTENHSAAQSDEEQPGSHAKDVSSRPGTPITRPGSVASSVPSSATDMDDDAVLRGDVPSPAEREEDDDEGLWAAAGDLPDIVAPRTNDGEADNEDMWNMVDEVMQTTNEEVNSGLGADWDDMYE